MSDGYAINEIGNGGINVSTVHTTRRAAIVNWLVVSKDVTITNDWTDSQIENAWRLMRGSNDRCVKVHVTKCIAPGSDVTDPTP